MPSWILPHWLYNLHPVHQRSQYDCLRRLHNCHHLYCLLPWILPQPDQLSVLQMRLRHGGLLHLRQCIILPLMQHQLLRQRNQLLPILHLYSAWLPRLLQLHHLLCLQPVALPQWILMHKMQHCQDKLSEMYQQLNMHSVPIRLLPQLRVLCGLLIKLHPLLQCCE